MGLDDQAIPRRLSCRGNGQGRVPSNREYTVEFDGYWSVVEYEDVEPVVGWTGAFLVPRLLEWTRRILLKRPAA
jgi:hypothetical protein